MAKLTPISSREVVRKLQALGFVGPISGGRHAHMIHAETGQMIPVPMHKGKDVGVGLIREIIRQVGIAREEWIES